MSLTDQLGKPASTSRQTGRYTLHRAHRCEASVAAPVTPINLNNIESIELAAPTYDSAEIYQQGGDDEYYMYKNNYRWTGNIIVHKGKAPYVLSQLKGITWDTGNDTAIPLRDDNDYPNVHWEAVARDIDNSTHLFTLLIQDMIIDVPGFSNPMDYSDVTIPFHTSHMPLFLAAGSEVVYDQFSGTGSAVDFTLSSTPLRLLSATSSNDLVLDQTVFVKVKLSTESTGTRKMSGVSYAGGIVTFTTAPAASSTVQILYAKAS